MVRKKVDRYRMAIIEYGIRLEELRISWLKTITERGTDDVS